MKNHNQKRRACPNWIQRLVGILNRGRADRLPKTHNYTYRSWGHNYTITEVKGLEVFIIGWGYGISKGDYIILQGQGCVSTRYLVVEIQYYRDPDDMWRMRAIFAPREIKIPNAEVRHEADQDNQTKGNDEN